MDGRGDAGGSLDGDGGYLPAGGNDIVRHRFIGRRRSQERAQGRTVDNTAIGVSLPIEPMASSPVCPMACKINLMSSCV